MNKKRAMMQAVEAAFSRVEADMRTCVCVGGSVGENTTRHQPNPPTPRDPKKRPWDPRNKNLESKQN